jgi:adenylate cyclase
MTDTRTGDLDLNPKVVRRRNVSDSSELQISQTIVRKSVSEKQGILLSDAAQDDRFESAVSLMKFNIRSMMCVPLVCQNEVLGIISIDTTQQGKKFDGDDLRLLTAIALPIATSIKNTQLVKEKEKEVATRVSMERFFSPNVVEKIVQGQLTTGLGGERKTGTAFFSDIVGFTKMATRIPAERVVQLLNRYFEHMVEILFRHSATIDKFSGDAIMAVWGAPEAVENGEWHAVQAGLEMQNALFEFNCGQLATGEETIQMGVGINSGSFVAGNVGAEQINYTIIGEDVNLAARVEAKAGGSQVFISRSTYDPVARRVCAIQLPPIELKGIPDPVTIYSVRGIAPIDEPDSGPLIISLPVEIGLPGNETTRGYLTGAEKDSSGRLVLDLLLPRVTEKGAALSGRFLLTELPDIPTFQATVIERVPWRGEGPLAEAARIVMDSAPPLFLALLTPGTPLPASVTWDRLVR